METSESSIKGENETIDSEHEAIDSDYDYFSDTSTYVGAPHHLAAASDMQSVGSVTSINSESTIGYRGNFETPSFNAMAPPNPTTLPIPRPGAISIKAKSAPIDRAEFMTLQTPPIIGPSPKSLNVERFSAVMHNIYTDLESEHEVAAQKGWMERKQHSPPYQWLKRWVVAEEGYLMWSDRQITIGLNGVDKKERKRWNKCIPIRNIISVGAIREGKTQRKFKIRVKDGNWKSNTKSSKKQKIKEYIWKAASPELRDHWVEDLNNMMFKQSLAIYKR